uniref:Zinc/iron permease n=1 Tax=Tetradesmus obliquus TaxID=3088 RepID=A0A383WMG0_TETOB|eukprot:jgi/Sobl393_1/18329/SZX77926.1
MEAAEYTLDLRIAACFVILAGALLLGMPTLLLKQFQDPDATVPRLLRGFAGGVIVALALVHIIPSAVGELNSLMTFPVGGCAILFGIIALVLIDNTMTALLAPPAYKQHIRDGLESNNKNNKQPHQHHHSAAATDPSDPKHAVAVQRDVEAATAAQSSNHVHQCMRTLGASSWLASGSKPASNVRQYVTAYSMELGCIFHSVIIGVGLGVLTESRSLIVTLMVALAVHQGLEALALGSVLALTSFSFIKKLAMLLMYSITTPIGIAIGIALSSSYDPRSVTSRAVQGTLNGVSGGMLLYIGMFQLIAEEFSREDMLVRPRLRLGMYGALCLGAASMCILGIWA